MRINKITESLERNYLTEKVNWDNEEINALLRKYVGKKNIPVKAQKAIEDAGIKINRDADGEIEFVGPNGKELSAYGRTYKKGPMKPQSHDTGYISSYKSPEEQGRERHLKQLGNSINRNDFWDMSKSGGQYNDPSVKAWDKVDMKGYLTKEKPSMTHQERRDALEYPGAGDSSYYTWRDDDYNIVSSQYAKNLRPYSDDYKRASDIRNSGQRMKDSYFKSNGMRTDDEIEAEVEKFRQKLIKEREHAEKSVQIYNDQINDANAEIDAIKARAKNRVHEGLNEDYDEVYMSVHEAIQNIMERACDNLAPQVSSIAKGWDPDVDWDWENDDAAMEWQRAFDTFVAATARYFTNNRR